MEYAEDGPPIVAGPENVARAKQLVQVLKKATPELGHRAQAEYDGPGSKTWDQIAAEFGCSRPTLDRAREAAGLKDERPEPRSPEVKDFTSDDLEPSGTLTVHPVPPSPLPKPPAPQFKPPAEVEDSGHDGSPDVQQLQEAAAALKLISHLDKCSTHLESLLLELGPVPAGQQLFLRQAAARHLEVSERAVKYAETGETDIDSELKGFTNG